MNFFLNTFSVALLVALVVSLLVTPFVRHVAIRSGVIDIPGEERRVHKSPTPRWGGMAIYLGVVIAWLIVYPYSHIPAGTESIGPYTVKSIWIMSLGACVVIFGLLDDKYQFPARWQAIFLLIVGFFLAYPSFGDIRIEGITRPFYRPGESNSWIGFDVPTSVILTMLFVFVIAKTMDTIDGIDGLAAGIAAIIAGTMLLLALNQQPLIGVLSAAVVGSCLGFLKYNYHPAKIFMGTGGAQFLGFFLAAVSIQGVVKTAAAVAFIVPVMVFGVPILDAFIVVVRRVLSRAPITQADKRHIHHTLLGKGLSQRQTVWILYLLAIVLCGTAIAVVKLTS